ncbi:MAG: tetratricopeptide repeat protein [Candidatus Binatia bacterium]
MFLQDCKFPPNLKDYPATLVAYRQSLDLWRTLSAESVSVASTLIDLASVERLSGDLAASERDFREAPRVARKVDNAEGVAIFTSNLAALELGRKNWPQAEALAREALPLSEKVGRQELIAEDCRRLAKVLVRQGNASEALRYA